MYLQKYSVEPQERVDVTGSVLNKILRYTERLNQLKKTIDSAMAISISEMMQKNNFLYMTYI